MDTHIGRVADELTEKDLLVRVESVDDETQQLVDLGLEGERLGLGRHNSQALASKENDEAGRELGFEGRDDLESEI